jgi:hypothetical protein
MDWLQIKQEYKKILPFGFGRQISWIFVLGKTPYIFNSLNFRFTTKLIIPQTGNYTLFIGSDDGSLLYLNGNKIIDDDGSHPVIEKSASLMLNQGEESALKFLTE